MSATIAASPLTVADVEALLATPEAYRSWLASQAHDYATVGTCGDPASCPLHEFLVASGFDGWCSVGRIDVELMLRGSTKLHKVELPEWARKFIRAVDGWKPMQRLLADEALDALEVVLADFGGPSHA